VSGARVALDHVDGVHLPEQLDDLVLRRRAVA
jgi:hypothetical protein